MNRRHLKLGAIAMILGVGLMGGALGSALGPWMAGRLFDLSGSYAIAFLIAAASGTIAGAAGWRARSLRRRALSLQCG